MVRTRSGRGTTKAENKEKPLSPKKPKKSPKKSSKLNEGWQYQMLIDFCVWKPTDKTFTYWACLKGLFFLLIAGYSVYDAVGSQYPDFHFFVLILGIHCFDILTNFCNELFGNGHLNDVILFTESGKNIGDIFLFLFMVNKTSNLFVTAAVLITCNTLALNIRFKNDEKIWVRLLSYCVLIACFVFNYQYIVSNCRITTYFCLVFASMIFDAFDFPDKYFAAIPMCEGLVIASRSFGIYMLITAQLLSGDKKDYTSFEYMIKAWIGM